MKKSIPMFFVAAVLCLLMLDSCDDKENPVTPPDEAYQFDSARFNWKVDTLYGQGFYAGLWAKDTNDIFITNVFNNRLYRIQNGVKSFIQYPTNTYLGVVTGDEQNNGYIVALKLIDSIYQPEFQKFDGNSFIEIPNPQNLKMNFFFNAVFIKNSNEMWIGSDGYENGFIVKFDGINLISYPLEDSRTKSLKFYYDENNKFKLLASIHHLDTDKTEFVIYEYVNNSWIKIYNDLDRLRPLDYKIINTEVAAVNSSTIFKLQDSALFPIVEVIPLRFQFPCAGYSFNNFLIASNDLLKDCRATYFHWDGYKWSLELCGYYISPDTDIIMFNDNIYYAITYDMNSTTYIMQGLKRIK